MSCDTEFEGRWKENRKHGQGIKKLKTGRMEEQVLRWNTRTLIASELTSVEFKFVFWIEQHKGADNIVVSRNWKVSCKRFEAEYENELKFRMACCMLIDEYTARRNDSFRLCSEPRLQTTTQFSVTSLMCQHFVEQGKKHKALLIVDEIKVSGYCNPLSDRLFST